MIARAKWLNRIKWDEHGLVPVITQEAGSNDVLMFAWMNRDALARTVELGQAVYWSRSRKKLWHKGEESGHFQQVHEIRLDCDEDVLLRRRAARLGRDRSGTEKSGRHLQQIKVMSDILQRLASVIESRKLEAGGDPDKSYVSRLFQKGDDAILKKIGEEATETVMAAKDVRNGAEAGKLVYECADLWFHSLIMLARFNLTPQQVLDELARREGISGIEEMANRKLEQREQTEQPGHPGAIR
jgi:phosphoribosyl-ATP pyrophosphohydrolase